MNAPPVPPRPRSSYEPQRQGSDRPPVPPLPPDYRPDESLPHFSDPLIAPRPQKVVNAVRSDLTQSLEREASYYASSSAPNFPMAMPAPPSMYNNNMLSPTPTPRTQDYGRASPNVPPASPAWLNPQPPQRGPSPATPQWSGSPAPTSSMYPQGENDWRRPSPLPPQSQPYTQSLSTAFADLSLQKPQEEQRARRQSVGTKAPLDFRSEMVPFAPIIPKPGPGQPPILTASLPTIDSLRAAASSVATSDNPARKLGWSKQVLNLVDRTQTLAQQLNPKQDNAITKISDPQLIQLTDQAIQQILTLCAIDTTPVPSFVAEALYFRGTLAASGSFPTYVPRDPRSAFKDFEFAARNGYHTAWFKIGRDYEGVNDFRRARDCFGRGVQAQEKNCLYRMGMAHLQGQLDLPKSPDLAIRLLKQSADMSDVDAPQSAYVFGMLLLGEFSHVDLPFSILSHYLPLPSPSNPEPRISEARRYIERSAYLNFGPAQYKSGWAYEYAKMGCAFDPLLSVQYYSLASQQGEDEADMALSKWFLCGAEGCFDKDESLAFTFAEKAAKKGLPTAEFAMGYYFEVGVGGRKDLSLARKWYEKAAQHGNPDAPARLQALGESASISREQHDAITHNKLVRKRTQAQERSSAAGRRAAPVDGRFAAQAAQHAVSASAFATVQPNDAPEQIRGARPQSPLRGSYPGGDRRSSVPQSRPLHHRLPSSNAPVPQGPPARVSSQPPPSDPPQRQRINLNDRPVSSVNSSSPSTSTSPLPSTRPAEPVRGQSSSPGGGKKGPATFAEMGFQSQALEERECIIM